MEDQDTASTDLEVRKSQIGRRLRSFIAMMAWVVTLALAGLVLVGIVAAIGVISAAIWWTFVQGWNVIG